MKHRTNPWTLLIAFAITGIVLMATFSGSIAVRTSTLATQNKIEDIKMRVETQDHSKGVNNENK